MTEDVDSVDRRSSRRSKVGIGTGRSSAAPPPLQQAATVDAPRPANQLLMPDDPPLPSGWRVIGRQELTEHLLSVRFTALLILLGLAGVLAIYAVAGTIRDAASQIPISFTGQQLPVFPLLFTSSPTIPGFSGNQFPSFAALVALIGPVLGIAFGFDAISSERSEGTLPRLVAQPIYRDDVINGKFAAGLVVISGMLLTVILLLAGVGILRLGIFPDGDVAIRLGTWFLVAVLYVGFWLALATLASVVFSRAATAALVVIAVWLILTFFGDQIVSLVAGIFQPSSADSTAAETLANAQLTVQLGRLNPMTVFTEATQALLNPLVQSLDPYFADPTGRALPTILPYTQSLLLIWPQVVIMVASTVACFAAAYVTFMRQEVRA
jgi:ABC-2 type transport system permease protein